MNSNLESAYDARFAAQRLAFAPFAFQIAAIARDWGLLAYLDVKIPKCADQVRAHVKEQQGVSDYAVGLMLEAAVSVGLCQLCPSSEGVSSLTHIRLSKMGYFLDRDPMTRVNFDFMRDVCLRGSSKLEESLRSAKPEGLAEFGEWPTIYQGLTHLPAKAQKSWFAFDHFYSDSAYKDAWRQLQKTNPRSLLDIGTNTGRFARLCLEQDPNILLGIMDLSSQVQLAMQNLSQFGERVRPMPCDVLSEVWPECIDDGFDAVWMSQFLDCFAPEDIVRILRNARRYLKPGGRLYVLEPFVDKQSSEQASFCVVQTSLYFTCMANGKSRMYRYVDFEGYLEQAGYRWVEPGLSMGFAHTLLILEPV